MKYRIVQMVDGHMVTTEPTDIVAWAEAAGIAIVDNHFSPVTRAVLQGEPVLAGFCGPMWDGDAVRYEDVASNDILSR